MSDRTADRLLLGLKTRGAMTTRALADYLGVSVPAVRRHLAQQGELVSQEDQAGRVGRPAKVWRLTSAGHARFPDTHADMTVRLIASTRAALGESALDAILAHRHEENVAAYRAALASARNPRDALERLARARSEEGYMATVEPADDGWLLVESHCPICAAATECQGFCANELQLFREVLGPDVSVTRAEYLLDGDARCVYSVTPVGSTDRSAGLLDAAAEG